MDKAAVENQLISNEQVMTHIKEIIACLTSCPTTKVFLESIHAILSSITYVENFYVVLKDQNDEISFPYFTDTRDSFTEEELNQLKIEDLHATLTYFALETNKPCNFTYDDIISLQFEGKVNMLGTVPRQWICFPLVNLGQTTGAIIMQSYRNDREYSDEVISLLLTISHIIASALSAFKNQRELELANQELSSHRDKLGELVLERTDELKQEKLKLEEEVNSRKLVQATLEQNLKMLQKEIAQNERLRKKLEFEANHDSLTGLANRKALYKAIDRLTAKMKRQHKPVYCLYLDLDGFKAINDNLGHEAGDAVLVKVSEHIASHIREYDLVARIGGDEFVILLDGVENKEVEQIAARIISDVEEPIHLDADIANVSVSIGIATSAEPEEIKESLMNNADQAMYKAKSQGQGKIVWV